MTVHTTRAVIAAARDAGNSDRPATLAVVLATEGSTYVAAGAMALFGGELGQVGWLSGGCLEPEIERVALRCAREGQIGWMEVDTRDDEDLMSGSALGCRGVLRIALLPLRQMVGVAAPLQAWLLGRAVLHVRIDVDGAVEIIGGGQTASCRLLGQAPTWPSVNKHWTLSTAAPPELLLLGAGPETPVLLPLLHAMGWMTTLAERRPRWVSHAAHADRHLSLAPDAALREAGPLAAALVMHHSFELDREALDALADHEVAFIGLLGPVRRREDLFRVLPAAHRDALLPRLRSPIGLRLGGQGAEAIALSIAAQLQAYRFGESSAGVSLRAIDSDDVHAD